MSEVAPPTAPETASNAPDGAPDDAPGRAPGGAPGTAPEAPATFPPPRPRSLPSRIGSRFLAAGTTDLPLKLLALVLAVLAWLVVREKILTDETVSNVPVDIVVPDSMVVLSPLDATVNLRLRGTWGEVARARAALAGGRGVRLSLQQIENLRERGPEGQTPPISTPSAFAFPFDYPQIVTVLTPLTVAWSVVEERTLAVEAPDVRDDVADVEAASVVPDETSVRLRGPAAVFRQNPKSIPLDSVDASSWLRRKPRPDLPTPWPWESRFEDWRKADPRYRNERVLRITPEPVRGKVQFRSVSGRVLERRLQRNAEDERWYDTHVYDIQRSPEYDPATRVLRVSLTGDPATLARLEANPKEWYPYVSLPAPPEDDADAHHEVPVALHLPPGAHAAIEKASTLFVTIRRKK